VSGLGARSWPVRPVLAPVAPDALSPLDVEIGAMPLAFGTAHNLLVRANVGAGSSLLVACEGEAAGYAAIRLARTLGAEVATLCPPSAAAAARAAGARVLVTTAHGPFDAVIDLGNGAERAGLLACLRPGGTYATIGTITEPPVRGQTRAVYLNDLTLFGRPHLPREVFAGLVSTITLTLIHLVETTPERSENHV
jgi:NADPH:quinone reductase-like Zn-dependent oxidoreductase